MRQVRRERPPRRRGARRRAHPLAGDRRWTALAKAWLVDHPWCARCAKRHALHGGPLRRPAVHVDHVIPVRIAPELALERSNLQSLCRPCHSVKTGHEARGRCYDYARGVVHGVTDAGS